MKKIYTILLVLMSAAIVGCREVAEITPVPEEEASLAKTGPATIDETEVTLEGRFIYDGPESVSAGFRYAKTQTELEIADIMPASMAGSDSFYLVLPDVANGDWWYQSAVKIGQDMYYGKPGFFKVSFSSVPSVSTLAAEMTEDSYILKGNYVFESKKITVVPGFFYAASEEELENASFVRADVNGKNFSYEVPASFGDDCWYSAAVLVNDEYYRGAVRHTGVTNLSAGGTANCFLVDGPGVYVFDAKKADGTQVAGDSAEWLWCTGTETILSDIKYNSGKIMFSVSDKTGSEMIALLKDGVIQWSWHIWVADGVREQSWDGITMMDRNLGALSEDAATANSIGLMYQWGRKDPFIGTNVMDKTIDVNLYESVAFSLEAHDRTWTAPYVFNKEVVPAGFSLKQTRCTEELAAQNPMVFYGNYNGGDWAGTNEQIRDYWGGVSLANTVNNPCPAGWRIPTHAEMAGYINGLLGNAGTTSVYADYAKSWGRKLTNGSETYNFPATGWREWHAALVRPGYVIAMHTSTLGAAECRASIYWDFNSAPGNNWTTQAFPVRCVKIK